jgi:hypothetical protein
VAWGGSAISEWLPGTELYENVLQAARAVEDFRFVLWQQGESDVIERTTREEYARHLRMIKESLEKDLGFARPWILAKSTLHPTVYHEPEQENAIRGAIEDLLTLPGFLRGPDTDILGGEHRAGMEKSRHWSEIGQRRAGDMWFAHIWWHLNNPE